MDNRTVQVSAGVPGTPAWKLWVRALRSGLYPRTSEPHAMLRYNHGLTAWGVLCDLAIAYGVISDFPRDGQAMPLEVHAWVRLRVPYRAPVCLDDNGRTFEGMADLIEAHADDLFYPSAPDVP